MIKVPIKLHFYVWMPQGEGETQIGGKVPLILAGDDNELHTGLEIEGNITIPTAQLYEIVDKDKKEGKYALLRLEILA